MAMQMCTLRLCGIVAKTLLVFRINKNGVSASSPSCLESYSVEERMITWWSLEQSCEDKTKAANGTNESLTSSTVLCSPFQAQ
ncbi:hypothetical protein ACSBR1_005824 [Camellia fascicularis]